MAVTSGTVEAIKSNPKVFNTKYGEKCHRSFKMDDQKWYTLIFDDPQKPSINRGDKVSFMYKEVVNGNFTNLEVEKKTLEVDGGTTQSDAAPVGNSSVATSNRVGGGVNSTQLAIQHQASRNSAIALARVAVEQGLVKLPTKQSDKYDALVALVDNLTAKYNTDTSQVTATGKLPLIEAETTETTDGDDEPSDKIPF